MILEGDTSVIDAIKEKKRLMDAREEHGHIKITLILDGGAMKGAYGVGAAVVFDELGYTKVFESIVGISSGAPTAAYLLSEQAAVGASILSEECCSVDFLNFLNLKNLINTTYIKDVLEGKTGKRLEVNKILSKQNELYIGVADYKTAKPVLLQPKTQKDLLSSIQASMAIPGMVTTQIRLHGKRYVDGASASPSILKSSLERVSSSHILIITNQDKETSDIPWFEKLTIHTIFRHRFSSKLLRGASNRRKTRHLYLRKILNRPTKPVCVVWGDGSIKSYEKNKAKVLATMNRSEEWWRGILA